LGKSGGDGNHAVGVAGVRSTDVIRAFAALTLLATSSFSLAATGSPNIPSADKNAASGVLDSATPWWEKLTVTIAGNGETRSCRWESSLQPANGQDCDVVGGKEAMGAGAHASGNDQYTRITFERRFSPGARPASNQLAVGDTLLGRQDLALAIDANGQVRGCRIVSTSGDMTPDYGCTEAQAERFQASASNSRSAAAREGTMSIIVYGHAEHVV
jgi:hypothetical protein